MIKVSRKGSRDVADHMTIQMDDSDSITVSEQSEPSAECWQNMYKLLNFYSLISDPTGILEKSSPENCLSGKALSLSLHLATSSPYPLGSCVEIGKPHTHRSIICVCVMCAVQTVAAAPRSPCAG